MRKSLPTAAVAALATLMLAPLPAAAQAVKGTAQQVLTQTGTCAPNQRATIRRGFADARQMANAAIASLALEPEAVRPHLKRFFGGSQDRLVAKNFRIIAHGLEQRENRLAYECNRAGACRGNTFAYVRWGGNAREVMGFCPAYFRAARGGQDSQGGIVIHEMSHLALGTRDHAYQPRGAEALAKDNPSAALMNADSYEYFAEFLPR